MAVKLGLIMMKVQIKFENEMKLSICRRIIGLWISSTS